MSAKDQLEPDAFSADDLNRIRNAVRSRYADTARSAKGKFKYPTGREGAKALGYNPDLIARMPDDLIKSFCGVGNPFSLQEIPPGSTLLDIGCGTGFDLIVASEMVGTAGRVYGIDLTEEMVQRAQENFQLLGITNSEVIHVSSEEIPFKDEMFDVVISNGAINLSPRKLKLFQEIYRVMKQGGSLQFADIVRQDNESADGGSDLTSWAQ